jgi:hypothetical protein
MPAHRILDHILFLILLSIPIVQRRWTWPRLLARLAAGERGVRGRFYRASVINQWTLLVLLLAYWRWYGRSWRALLLGGSSPLRFSGGMAVALLIAWLLYRQRVQILGSEKARERTRRMIAYAEPILPHGPNENRLFKVVSITAGVCEETLFRGFLLWYLGVWTGTAVAIVLSSTLFGLGHSYQGMKQVPRTAAAGLVFACVAVVSRTLWPAIVIHAAMDWNSGEIGYQLLRTPAPEKTQA